jgi:phage major head subunit gpT-like protein
MPMIKAEWAEALTPAMREWFSIGYAQRPTMIPSLYDVMGSTSDHEDFMSFGAIAPDAWDEYKTSGRVPQVGFDKGYKTTFTHDEFVVEYQIQKTLIEDSKYPQITSDVSQLGDSAALKREQDAMKPFINCALAGAIGGDGVPLCDNSHPVSPTKSGTTQDNLDALALTAANVETIRQKMLVVKDDTGNLAGVQPNLLVVAGGGTLENDAKLITQTDGKVGSADNDVNVQKGRFTYVVLPMLTSATQWFMVDSIKMKQSLKWFDRVPLSIVPKVEDKTIFATWIARMRYSYGWRDWRWINRGNA